VVSFIVVCHSFRWLTDTCLDIYAFLLLLISWHWWPTKTTEIGTCIQWINISNLIFLQNFEDTVHKLACFLEVERDRSFYRDLEKACNINSMKQNKYDDTIAFDRLGRSTLYRKGGLRMKLYINTQKCKYNVNWG
jgi:hypothetical protein